VIFVVSVVVTAICVPASPAVAAFVQTLEIMPLPELVTESTSVQPAGPVKVVSARLPVAMSTRRSPGATLPGMLTAAAIQFVSAPFAPLKAIWLAGGGPDVTVTVPVAVAVRPPLSVTVSDTG
jgi:hypothetical protein